MEHLPDEVLFTKFRAGDEAALGELARRYERSLLGVAFGLLGRDRESVRDAVQETWLRVIRYAGGFRESSSFRTWLYRILVNQSRTLAQKRRRVEPTISVARERIEPNAAEGPPLAEAVALLDEDKREVLLLCHHRGLTDEQVASILEIPVGTVKSRLHAAVVSLRERLASEMVS